ncbi:MAG: hypothetical protein ACREIE_05715 [Nitrospiraceae bacterium]
MKTIGVVTLLLTGLLLITAASVEAQLAKSGTYTSHFGYHYVTKASEIDKDHVFITGEVVGTNLNEAGRGFLHATAVVCQLVNDSVKGSASAHGYCTATDADGDKAFSAWKCKSQPGARCEGDFLWIGGTGKYTGIKGNNTFHAGPVPKTASGYAVWKGEWQLPQ